jgi:hypothetical protein
MQYPAPCVGLIERPRVPLNALARDSAEGAATYRLASATKGCGRFWMGCA